MPRPFLIPPLYGLLLGGLLLAAPLTRAEAGDDCAAQFPAAEDRWGIPKGLLAAIAQVESRGWPWTIDAAGESRSFASRAEAEAAAAAYRAQGLRNIDLGCMQISMLHHPDAFASLSQAFDPAANVDYAARFLTGLKRLAGSWEAAVGRYHSATPALGGPYLQRVLAAWHGGAWTAVAMPRPLSGFTVETRFGVHVWRPVTHPPETDGQAEQPPAPRYLIIVKQKRPHPPQQAR